MKSDFFGDGFADKIILTTKNQLNGIYNNIESLTLKDDLGNNRSKLYKLGTTILGLTTTIISPILEIVIIFLPEILNFLFKGQAEKKKREELQNKMLYEVFPGIHKRV